MTTPPRKRIAVLISGRGSNMEALIEASRAADFPGEIVLVLSNRPEAKGLETAAAAGIDTLALDHKAYPDRAAHEAAVAQALDAARPDVICLAGYMRLLGRSFVERFLGRMINIHPSLLPLFPGLHTHERAIEAGMRVHGCTVHFVTEEMDGGPIIAQAAVPILPGDDADTLSSRLLRAEHRLYPHALAMLLRGDVAYRDGRAELRSGMIAATEEMLLSPA
ncbi:phosphoribosylglycinamide formyltransferase [Aureimonas altamirensis]|uniref:Phosphoribosylglycinamide formyltransferase n=1 Tax=Aureimonas altamirensis TaxID=370622 RepID=A0A0B1Q6F0_9HYPH|nr:phosphoribosylglycinamide formyltransferase [Aureimonas altamirensis]KHJ56423.1 phosphoribosylglycinamide formyltransferase [Aureimonas altamirensis]